MTIIIIGENIRALRDNFGFTQYNLAQFAGVGQSLIAKIEKGDLSISVDMLGKISTLFGVTVDRIENQPLVTSKHSFAFRGSELSVSEMEAISSINKIALNSGFMKSILKEAE